MIVTTGGPLVVWSLDVVEFWVSFTEIASFTFVSLAKFRGTTITVVGRIVESGVISFFIGTVVVDFEPRRPWFGAA